MADIAFGTRGRIEALQQGLIGLQSLTRSTRSLFALTLQEDELRAGSLREVTSAKELLSRSDGALVVLSLVGGLS